MQWARGNCARAQQAAVLCGQGGALLVQWARVTGACIHRVLSRLQFSAGLAEEAQRVRLPSLMSRETTRGLQVTLGPHRRECLSGRRQQPARWPAHEAGWAP